MEKKTLGILGGVVILVVVLLIVGGRQTNPVVVSDDGTEIPCLPNGHQQVASHIHPVVSITVDGEAEIIPGNVGIDGFCMREIHTHDATGTLHIETAKPGVVYGLLDFFTVWGQDIDRAGYDLEIMQDGTLRNREDVIFTDHSSIELVYTSIE